MSRESTLSSLRDGAHPCICTKSFLLPRELKAGRFRLSLANLALVRQRPDLGLTLHGRAKQAFPEAQRGQEGMSSLRIKIQGSCGRGNAPRKFVFIVVSPKIKIRMMKVLTIMIVL